MTPEASRLIAQQEEDRVLSLILTEASAASALAAARQIGLAVGLTFVASWVAAQFYPDYGLVSFIFGPMLVTHLLWFQRIFDRAAAKKAIDKLPMWERHRVSLLLQRVDSVVKEAK